MYLAVVVVTALGFLVTSAQADPQKIILTSRAKLNRLQARAIEPSTLPLDDFFLSTDLQWFGNISVGTPPQQLTVIFDTGSPALEITSTLCRQACANQLKFNPSRSSSFVDGGFEFNISFATGLGVDPVVDDDYVLNLRNGTDTVSVAGLTVADTNLSLITNQTAKFSIYTFSGILGMGSDKTAGFFGALIKQGLPSLFSLYLTPKSVGNAEITFGGIDETKFNGTPIYASLSQLDAGDSSWVLASTSLFINSQTTPLLISSRSIIFDSGTSNVAFPTNITNPLASIQAIYAMISPDIKPNPKEPGAYGIPCQLISSLPAQIDITFTSQQGVPFNLTIPSSEFNLGPFADDSSICQTLINAFDGFQILGGSLLKHYYSIWDVGAQRLGFAPAASVPS